MFSFSDDSMDVDNRTDGAASTSQIAMETEDVVVKEKGEYKPGE